MNSFWCLEQTYRHSVYSGLKVPITLRAASVNDLFQLWHWTISACPSKCAACTYDADKKSTVCTDGQCDSGYAKNADDGKCEGKYHSFHRYATLLNVVLVTYYIYCQYFISNKHLDQDKYISVCCMLLSLIIRIGSVWFNPITVQSCIYMLWQSGDIIVIVACPANCDECEFDATDKKVVCKDSKCKSGYGRIKDKTCAGFYFLLLYCLLIWIVAFFYCNTDLLNLIEYLVYN